MNETNPLVGAPEPNADANSTATSATATTAANANANSNASTNATTKLNTQSNEEIDGVQRRRLEEMEQWLLQQEQAEADEIAAAITTTNNNTNDNTNNNTNNEAVTTDLVERREIPVVNEEALAQEQQLALLHQQQQQLVQQQLLQQQTSSKSFWCLRYRPASMFSLLFIIWYALRTRHQYYLAAVYLCSSKWAYVVIGNAILVVALTVFDATVYVALRGLRLQEAESLADFVRWNITETCLALTMFRNELTVGTALQFVALVTVKCLHHVATQREQNLRLTQDAVQDGFPYLCTGHLRVVSFLWFLQAIDIMVVQYAVAAVLKDGPTVQILFVFEAAILLVSAWSHMVLWHLHVIDSIIQYGHEHEWHFTSKLLHPWKDYKATLTFVVELQAQAVNFLFYSTFFAIVLTFYGPPLNLFREVYLSLAKLKERLTAFFNYRHLMASMNRFQSATNEQLDEVGRTCIICRDEMCTNDCKRLPGCAHTFHRSCLREWLVQQQTCPICRSDIAAMEAQEATRNATAQAATQRGETTPTTNVAIVDDQVAEKSSTDLPESKNATIDEAMLTNESQRSVNSSTSEAGVPVVIPQNESGRIDPSTLVTGEDIPVDILTLAPELENTEERICPTLFEVSQKQAVPVYDLSNVTIVTRSIDPGMIVLVLARQQRDKPSRQTWLRIPDGWMEEDALRAVCEI